MKGGKALKLFRVARIPRLALRKAYASVPLAAEDVGNTTGFEVVASPSMF